MEFSNRIQPKHKAIILDVFNKFISICKENKLRYYCVGGTLIGIVRHQGMIPWDDDIDILMPRPDYDRLLKLFDENRFDNYKLITPGCDTKYYLPYTKIYAENTTLLEYHDIPCLIGVFIDIFPLDGASDNEKQRLKDYIRFRREANKLMIIPKTFSSNMKAMISNVMKFHLRRALYELKYSVSKEKSMRKVIDKVEKSLRKYSYRESQIVGNYCGMYEIREFIPREWVDSVSKGIFESLEVDIPAGYEKYLKQIYGDFMQLPPKEKQVIQHHVAYLNLNERKSLPEVKEILKSRKNK